MSDVHRYVPRILRDDGMINVSEYPQGRLTEYVRAEDYQTLASRRDQRDQEIKAANDAWHEQEERLHALESRLQAAVDVLKRYDLNQIDSAGALSEIEDALLPPQVSTVGETSGELHRTESSDGGTMDNFRTAVERREISDADLRAEVGKHYPVPE